MRGDQRRSDETAMGTAARSVPVPSATDRPSSRSSASSGTGSHPPVRQLYARQFVTINRWMTRIIHDFPECTQPHERFKHPRLLCGGTDGAYFRCDRMMIRLFRATSSAVTAILRGSTFSRRAGS